MAKSTQSDQHRPRSPDKVHSDPVALDTGQSSHDIPDNISITNNNFVSTSNVASSDIAGNNSGSRMHDNLRQFDQMSNVRLQHSAEVIRLLKSEISDQKIHLQQLQLEKLTDRAIIETLKSKLTIMLHPEDNSESKMSRCGTDPLPEAPDCLTDSSMSSSGHPITQPQCDDNLNDCGQTLRAISRYSSESSNEGFELVPREQNEQQRDLIASQTKREQSERIEELERQLSESTTELETFKRQEKARVAEIMKSITRKDRRLKEQEKRNETLAVQLQQMSTELNGMKQKFTDFDRLSTENVELTERLTHAIEQLREHEEAFRDERADREALNKEKKKFERYYLTYETERDAALLRVRTLEAEREQERERSHADRLPLFSPMDTSHPSTQTRSNELPTNRSNPQQTTEPQNQACSRSQLNPNVSNTRLVLPPRVELPDESFSRLSSVTSGVQAAGAASPLWTCKLCTFDNQPRHAVCELCRNPRYVSNSNDKTNDSHLVVDDNVDCRHYAYNDELT